MLRVSKDLLSDMIENHIRDQCTLPNSFVLNKIQFNNQLTLINQEVR
jgi:hypothetical protein